MKVTAAFLGIALLGVANSGYLTDDHGDAGYGSLGTIAKGSVAEAHSAVSSQHFAAQKASYVAKSTLALKATQAAATAQAALTGKHVLLETLEKYRVDAHQSLEGELAQLQSAQHTATATSNTAQQAGQQVALLNDAIKQAEQLAHQAETSAKLGVQETESQSKMVAQAKERLAEIDHKLMATRTDFVATKAATQKAIEFARRAKNNAADVGGHGDTSEHVGY